MKICSSVPHTLVVLAVAGAAAFRSQTATAQVALRPIERALRVEGTGGCLEQSQLAQQIATWLGRETIDARVSLLVRVWNERQGAATARLLVQRDGQIIAERDFRQPTRSCSEMRAALGLGIALAVDATVLDSLGVTVPAQPPAAERIERPSSPPPPREVAHAGRYPSVAAAVEPSLSAGVVPSISVGGYAGFELGVSEMFSVRVGALGTAPASIAIEPGAADVSLVAGRIDGCLFRAFRPKGGAGIRSCAGVAAGQVLAQGRGFESSRSTEILWLAAATRLEVHVPVTSALALRGSLEGWLPFVRPRLEVVQPSGTLFASRTFDAVGVGLGAGVAWRFW